MAKVTINHEKVQELVVKKLTEVGLSDVHAKKVAEILVYADLRNVHSHGVLRTEHYVKSNKSRRNKCSCRYHISQDWNRYRDC